MSDQIRRSSGSDLQLNRGTEVVETCFPVRGNGNNQTQFAIFLRQLPDLLVSASCPDIRLWIL